MTVAKGLYFLALTIILIAMSVVDLIARFLGLHRF
jgi:hypothetical protein